MTPTSPSRAAAPAHEGASVLVVDNREAVLASLDALLATHPAIHKVDAVRSSGLALKRAAIRRPDVCLVHDRVGDDAGLLLTRCLKQGHHARAVIVYSERLDGLLAGAAYVAGADAVVTTSIEPDDLGQLIGAVARGERHMPVVPLSALRTLSERVEPADRPILSMLVHETPAWEIAGLLGVTLARVESRRWAMLQRLRPGFVAEGVEPIVARPGGARTAPRTDARKGRRIAEGRRSRPTSAAPAPAGAGRRA